MTDNLSQSLSEMSLPPAYRLHIAGIEDSAHAMACTLAPKRGAGTLVVRANPALIDMAVVLEPDEVLRSARRVFFACMAALGDALATHAPPEKPLIFGWPATLLCDGAMVGGGRLATPAGIDDNQRPDWLVFSAQITIRHEDTFDAGLHPYSTTLENEGFENLSANAYIESFTRHLMTHIDLMQHKGFRPVAEAYLMRLQRDPRKCERQIDPFGNLITRFQPNTRGQTTPLLPDAENPEWFDTATGIPRL